MPISTEESRALEAVDHKGITALSEKKLSNAHGRAIAKCNATCGGREAYAN